MLHLLTGRRIGGDLVSLNLEEKKAVVAEVSALLGNAQAAAVAEYRGLTVAQMTKLRVNARKADVYFRVVKNTLVRRAVTGSQFECLKDQVKGPLAFAVSKDPVAVAKVFSDFAKDNEKFVIKASAMGGKLMSVAELKALATLPNRETLLAMLLGAMNGTTTKFVRTLNEVPSRFVRTLAAVRDAKAQAGGA